MSTTATPSGSSAFESEIVNPRVDEIIDASTEEAEESSASRRNRRAVNGATATDSKPKYRWVWEKNPVKRPVPERFSLPLILFWIFVAIRAVLHVFSVDWRFNNPQLTRIDDLLQRKRIAKRKLKRYSRFRRRTIAVFNSKGGAGKSPTIAHLVASVRKIMGLVPLLIDMNQNFGKTLINLLRPGASLGLKEAIERSDEFSDEFLDRHAGMSARGKVQIIVSQDIDGQTSVSNEEEEEQELTKEEIQALWLQHRDETDSLEESVQKLQAQINLEQRKRRREKRREIFRKKVERIKAVAREAGKYRKLIGIDTGNGMSHEANIAAMEIADALLFVGLWSDTEALGGIGDTIWGYFRRKFFLKISQRGFVVIVGVPPKVKKEQVYKRLGEEIFKALHHEPEKVTDVAERARLADNYLRYLCITPERLFIIPYSKHVATRQLISGKTKIIGLAAKVAYMELMVSIYELEIRRDLVLANAPESFEEAYEKLVGGMDPKYTSQISEDEFVDGADASEDSNHLKEVTP